MSNNIIASTLAAAGNPLLQSQNVDFTLFKIAPNANVCGPFPIPFEKGRCCDDVEKWNMADKNNDTVISKCEEKVYNVEKKCERSCTPPPVPPSPCEPEKPCHRKHHRHHRR